MAVDTNLASGAFGAHGTVLTVPLDGLPDWLPAWCLDHLGGEPADVLFQLQQTSMVFGLRLADGTDVVVKARADDGARCHAGPRSPAGTCPVRRYPQSPETLWTAAGGPGPMPRSLS